MKGRKKVCFSIKSSWHSIARMYNEEATQYNLTVSVGYVLLTIDENDGTPATHLGPLAGMESRSLTRMLSSLEKEGLIVKANDDKDKRLVKIYLTPKGKQKKVEAKQIVNQFNAKVRSQIPEEKLDVFFEVIDAINYIITEKQIFNNNPSSN